jgi:hypothetical protein
MPPNLAIILPSNQGAAEVFPIEGIGYVVQFPSPLRHTDDGMFFSVARMAGIMEEN